MGLEAPAFRGPNYYGQLGVDLLASQAQIRGAFRKLAKRWHPDRNPGTPNAKEKFQELQQAYQVLSNADTRREYDLEHWIEMLPLEEYLGRYEDFILTSNGLGITNMDPTALCSLAPCDSTGLQHLCRCISHMSSSHAAFASSYVQGKLTQGGAHSMWGPPRMSSSRLVF